MAEIEPQYFKEFRVHIDKKFENFEKHIDKKIDDKIDNLAVSIQKQFRELDFNFDGIQNEIAGVKENMGKIEAHIGRYEVRAQNIEEILLEDYKPRLNALEKVVFV
jgi:archaellum component FlaC